MTMELEGNLSPERPHTRLWLSVVAVIVPVASVVLLATWFVRVYVAPATILIPNPPMIVAEAPEPPAVSARVRTEAPQPPAATAEPANPPASERTASALPMFATLAVVPLPLGGAGPVYADAAEDSSPTASVMVAEPDAMKPGEPIAGRVPLPRAKPHGRVALLASAIPLPRPRPAEIAPPPEEIPAVGRHEIH